MALGGEVLGKHIRIIEEYQEEFEEILNGNKTDVIELNNVDTVDYVEGEILVIVETKLMRDLDKIFPDHYHTGRILITTISYVGDDVHVDNIVDHYVILSLNKEHTFIDYSDKTEESEKE